MKIIIKESQLETIKENILKIPFSAFNNDWNLLQRFLNKKGNPPYILRGNIDLNDNEEITTLGNLISVEGNVNLWDSSIKSIGNLTSVTGSFNIGGTLITSLGNLKFVGRSLLAHGTPIESIGNLTSVGGDLNLRETPIESLGNLNSVRYDLYLQNTPISKKYSEREIRNMVVVGGDIYL
jgi:hypothetical protein